MGRREALRSLALAGGASVLPAIRRARKVSQPTILVVGAGLAGLTAAYRIFDRTGWKPIVIEAADRPGGRVRTIRDLPGDLYCEAGGTFISTGDSAIRSLLREVDIGTIDLDPLWPDGGYAYYFNDALRKGTDVFRGEGAASRVAERQFEQFRWPITYRTTDPDAVRLDRMTIAEWIERHVDEPLFADYLKTYYETDYGSPIDEASALHLVADFAAPGRSYDERFLIKGGSDSLITALVERLPELAVHTGATLLSIAKEGRRYECLFSQADVWVEQAADAVVLALPFTALRKVNKDRAGFSKRKLDAITDLAMGQGTKVNMHFSTAPWEQNGSGDSVSDLVTGWTWPGHIGQNNLGNIMVGLTSTIDDEGPVHGEMSPDVAQRYLDALEEVFPGTETAYTGYGYIDRWTDDPLIGGTYSYYRAGTFTEIAGSEAEREGRVFFAGEHTARYGNRGTMNGAVQSGERAARQVIRALR